MKNNTASVSKSQPAAPPSPISAHLSKQVGKYKDNSKSISVDDLASDLSSLSIKKKEVGLVNLNGSHYSSTTTVGPFQSNKGSSSEAHDDDDDDDDFIKPGSNIYPKVIGRPTTSINTSGNLNTVESELDPDAGIPANSNLFDILGRTPDIDEFFSG